MVIKVLGGGCANCKRTKEVAQQVIGELGLEAQVESVTDMADIASYGVVSTPALVIDEQVVRAGGVPTPQQMRDLLIQAQG